MSLTTYSKFYYGHTVTTENQLIDFNEGGAELTAELQIGDYSLTEFVAEVKRALDVEGALTYTVSVNRSTRIITIAASGNFALLTTTGSHLGSDAFTLLGFSGADKTGAATYTASVASGSVYSPQFILQDHKPKENFQKSIDASVAKTASGRVEVVRFGVEKFVQAKIKYATNITQPSNGPIRSNSTGVTDLQSFMQYITTKAKIEYMPDESDVNTYETLILDSNEESQSGTGYELSERYDIGLPGYFDTTVLRFRVIE